MSYNYNFFYASLFVYFSKFSIKILYSSLDLLINFFKKYINFDKFCNLFEYGYFDNSKPTFTHS